MKKVFVTVFVFVLILSFVFQPSSALAISKTSVVEPESQVVRDPLDQSDPPVHETTEQSDMLEHMHPSEPIVPEHRHDSGDPYAELLMDPDLPEELRAHLLERTEPIARPEYTSPSSEVIERTEAQVESFSCADVTDVPQIECEALVALYASTNGAGWLYGTNWLVTNTVDNWFGIDTAQGQVIGISLFQNELNGFLPIELGNLSNLSWLRADWNKLGGTIPTTLGALSNLTYLDLSWNYHITGSIDELCSLANLIELNLGINALTGSIPIELGSMTNLTKLYLSSNALTGSIPTSLGNLNNLKELGLGGNQLTGEIPSFIGNLTKLELLWLDHNLFTGGIPASFSGLANLGDLLLDNNQLSGNIPLFLGNLTKIWRLSLAFNQFSGSIPSQLGNLINLRFLDLAVNYLSGSLPAELGNLTSLSHLYLFSNELSGVIPLTFTKLTNLDDFLFYDTYLCEPNTPEFLAWKATVARWREGICRAPIEITHVEWTQAVQDYGNNVPLIDGKDTLVRVFVKSQNIPIQTITGTLTAKRGDMVLSGSPTSWVRKQTYSGSINFVLPKSWVSEGNLEITIKITNASPQIRVLNFGSAPEIRIVYVPIEIDGNKADSRRMANAVTWIRDAYPNSNITYKQAIFSSMWDPDPSCNKFVFFVDQRVVICRALDLLKKLSNIYDLYYEQGYDFIIGWLPEEAKNLFSYNLGYSWLNGISSPLWAGMDGKSLWVGEWSNMGTTFAHELGHNLDQRHSNSSNCYPGNIDPNSDWPWSDSSYIHDTGWRSGTETFYPAYQYFDVMSYCDPQWISKHTFTEIYNYWTDFKQTSNFKINVDEAMFEISGLIFSDDTATMDPIWESQAPNSTTYPQSGTSYCVSLLDSSSLILNQQCFDLDFIDYETQESSDTEFYRISMPVITNISKIVLTKGELVLASREFSQNAPQVTLTSPNGGENWGTAENVTITWIGSDIDDDTLSYNIYYSADEGISWEPLAFDLTGNSMVINAATIPGSTVALIKVCVTDGVKNNCDESDMTFSVLSKGPEAMIINDEGRTDYLAGRFVTLKGIGYDLEDGSIIGESLCWSSDLDGELGCGKLIAADLSLGAHIITLRVLDSDGNISEDTATINIISCFEINTYTTPLDAGKVAIDQTPNCSADPVLYAAGTSVNLDVEANRGFDFIEWGDGIEGKEVPKVISVYQDLLINAIFNQTEFFIHLPLVVR